MQPQSSGTGRSYSQPSGGAAQLGTAHGSGQGFSVFTTGQLDGSTQRPSCSTRSGSWHTKPSTHMAAHMRGSGCSHVRGHGEAHDDGVAAGAATEEEEKRGKKEGRLRVLFSLFSLFSFLF